MKFVKAKLFGKQKGITLVETSIGLAIAAVIVGTAYAGFESNSRRNEVQTNASLITEMISDAKKMFGQPGRYGDGTDPILTTGAAIASRVIPDSLVTGTTALNSYGGEILIEGDADGAFARLEFPNVPERQCMDLAMALGTSVQGMAVNTTAATAPTTWGVKGNESGTTMDIAALQTACAGASNGVVTLHVTFPRG